LAYSRDFELPLRVGIAAGGLAAGDGSANWQSLALDARLFEGAGTGPFAPALFVGLGLGRYFHEQSPDGYDTHRDTLAASAGLLGELRPGQGADAGFTLSLGLHGLLALMQKIQNHDYEQWQSYDVTVLAALSVG
jgi:hypothetical protein